MARKIVIFSDCCWVRPQSRSKNRQVPGNVPLAHQCVLAIDNQQNEQIAYLSNSNKKYARGRSFFSRNFGVGLKRELLDAYTFLSRTYQPGDQIFLIGSGVGAYNLRRLADMLDRVGLLPPDRLQLLPDAFEYSQIPVDALKTPAAEEINQSLKAQRVRIKFIGCWDTVGSYGLPLPGLNRISQSWMMLHDHKINRNVGDTAYQALALDEYRRLYKPGLWTGAHSPDLHNVEQVWFAGSHDNVVGGRRDSGLSHLALNWLVNRAQEQGLHFDLEKLSELSAPDHTGKISPNLRRLFNIPLSLGRPGTRLIDQTTSGFGGFAFSEPEKLHESVVKRLEEDKEYRPRQLASLRPGDVPVFHEQVAPLENKRRHFRRKVDWPATLHNGDDKLNASLVDYSKSGACVWFQGKVPVGTTLILQSSRAFVEGLKATVIWTKDSFAGLEFSSPLQLDHVT